MSENICLTNSPNLCFSGTGQRDGLWHYIAYTYNNGAITFQLDPHFDGINHSPNRTQILTGISSTNPTSIPVTDKFAAIGNDQVSTVLFFFFFFCFFFEFFVAFCF